jgi:hypothetical protein
MSWNNAYLRLVRGDQPRKQYRPVVAFFSEPSPENPDAPLDRQRWTTPR